MGDTAAFKPAPESSDHVAVAPRANEPPGSAQAGGLLRPSQVPVSAGLTSVTGSSFFGDIRVHTDGARVGTSAGPDLVGGLLRPSQVPVSGAATSLAGSLSPAGGLAHHQRHRLRPSGAPAGVAPVPARPSAVPARPVPGVLPGSGRPLAAPVREEMEARLGGDFTRVRVHADRAVQAPTPAGDTVQRAAVTVEGGPAGQPGNRRGDGTVPAQCSTVREVLASAGQPLAAPLRQEMEARLGADFSDVRMHTDRAAQQSAAAIGARAYTSGSHVVIGEGGAGPHTLAHELTHVVQQCAGLVSGARNDGAGGLRLSGSEDRFERAAEANADRALTGPTPDPGARLAPGPVRAPTPASDTIQLASATVRGGPAGNSRQMGEGNVGMGGTGGVTHAEQIAWNEAERHVLPAIGAGGGGSYAVVFDVDTKICDRCRDWFDGPLFNQIHSAAAGASQGPVNWTLTVSVGGHHVQVTGPNTVWPPEVADTHTFGRLGDVGMSLRLLSDRRDTGGRLTGNAAAPAYSQHAETHAQPIQANDWSNPVNAQILQQALTDARTNVARNGGLQARYGETEAELLTTLTSATLHEGVLSGRLGIDDLLAKDPAIPGLQRDLRLRFEAWLEGYLEETLDEVGTKNINVHVR